MRINPNVQSQLSSLSEPKAMGSKSRFENVLASKQSGALKELRIDLKQVSYDLKSGKITEEQAGRQFVNLVLNKRNELNLSGQGLAKIQTAIGDLIIQDPSFMAKLQSELKKI